MQHSNFACTCRVVCVQPLATIHTLMCLCSYNNTRCSVTIQALYYTSQTFVNTSCTNYESFSYCSRNVVLFVLSYQLGRNFFPVAGTALPTPQAQGPGSADDVDRVLIASVTVCLLAAVAALILGTVLVVVLIRFVKSSRRFRYSCYNVYLTHIMFNSCDLAIN